VIAPVAQPAEMSGGYTASAYCESESDVPAMKVCREKTFDCFNCGDDDHCQNCLRHGRKKFDSTWYPRIAPYCISGWGYTQPCWRRTLDTYNCPPQTMPRSSFPVRAEEPAALEPMPEGNPAPEENPVPEISLRRRESASRR
jgi:hypothetical protein